MVKLQGGGLRLEEGVQKRWLAGTLFPSKPPCSWNATKLFRLLVAMAVIISRVGDAAEAKRERIVPEGWGSPVTELRQELYSLATAASYACPGWLHSYPFQGVCEENQLPH